MEKTAWSGRVVAVQPRIRLMRSFDQGSHGRLGYVFRIEGTCGGQTRQVLVAVGEGAHEKHRFHAGMELHGLHLGLPNAGGNDHRPVELPNRIIAGLTRIERARGSWRPLLCLKPGCAGSRPSAGTCSTG